MPDPLHLFCAPRDMNFTLDHWITYWKRQFKRNLNNLSRPGGPSPITDRAQYRWQEGKPWDTRLRRSESYQEKWQYVRENPLRKKLVENLDDWQFQGMLNVLPW